MPAPIVAAAALAARLAARKLAKDSAKKSVKKALKTAKKTKPLAEPKSAVKVLPRKTSPKTDLSNRGNKPTRLERSERAAELSFKKAEGRYEGEYLTRMTGLKGPKGVTSQRTRGQGTRSLRKEAAINKEAKRIVKINSKGMNKAERIAFNNLPPKQGNKKTLTGSVRKLKKSVKKSK